MVYNGEASPRRPRHPSHFPLGQPGVSNMSVGYTTEDKEIQSLVSTGIAVITGEEQVSTVCGDLRSCCRLYRSLSGLKNVVLASLINGVYFKAHSIVCKYTQRIGSNLALNNIYV